MLLLTTLLLSQLCISRKGPCLIFSCLLQQLLILFVSYLNFILKKFIKTHLHKKQRDDEKRVPLAIVIVRARFNPSKIYVRKGNINSNIRDPLLLLKYKRKSKQLCTNNFIQKTIICDSVHKYTVSNTALQHRYLHLCHLF